MKEKIKKIRQSGHRLTTRRDFLAQGLVAFSASMALPTSLLFGYQRALADCGGGPEGSALFPFMTFDMAGGAALPGNFLVGKKGGPQDLLKSYNTLGWNPAEAGALNTDFGLPMSAKYSKILQGILTNASAEARANLRMGSICHFAQDDTDSNKLNVASLVIKAGLRGAYITNGMGIVSTNSGGNSQPILNSAIYKPNFIKTVNDVIGATSFGGKAFEGYKISNMKSMANAGVALSQIQKNDFLNLPQGDVLAEVSKCAYEKSLTFLDGAQGLDPRGDQDAQTVFQINQNSDPGAVDAVVAALVMNTIKGYSGPSVWTVGDCDYHTGEQTKGDRKDLEMGIQIGRAVEMAKRLGKPFFFQLITDGGCNSSTGTRNWSGDSGDRCMSVIGYYNPKAPPKMIRQQVGYYTDGQGVERTTLVGNEPALAGYAALANYMNVCGKIGEFQTVAPGVFTNAQLDSVLIFEKMV